MKVDKEDPLTGEGEAHEDTTLNAGIEEFAVDFEAGDITSSGDVADSFHSKDDVDC